MRQLSQFFAFVLLGGASSDRRQSNLIKRNLQAVMFYAACSSLLVYGVWIGVAQVVETYLLIAGIFVSCVLFYMVFRSGLNLRLSDPSMALPQTLMALTWSACTYGVVTQAHGGILMQFAVVLVAYNMNQRQAYIALAYAIAIVGLVMLYKGWTDPLIYRADIQLAFFLMFIAILSTVTGIVAALSRMRIRGKEQKRLLAEAMRSFTDRGEVPITDSRGDLLQDELWRQFTELAHQRHDLEERRSIMLAAISHDLRSPLARIRMAAELLPHAQEMPVRREAILRNVDVANRLLTSFIDMAYAEEEPVESRVNLRTLTMSVASSLPGVRLVELPEEEVWLAPASSVALERALRNLIDNAVVHGQPPVEMGLRCNESTLLWVRDHGEGVDESQYELLFQPFIRGDSNRIKPGTGLGLAVVARTALRHGGRVKMTNELLGLRVEMHLPRCQAGDAM
jgi:signal transduction histidine kinase